MAFAWSEVKAKVPNMVLSTQYDLTPVLSSSSYGISLLSVLTFFPYIPYIAGPLSMLIFSNPEKVIYPFIQ